MAYQGPRISIPHTPMADTHPNVTRFLRDAKAWSDELAALRAILLDGPLSEDFKWRQPCYTYDGSNVVILGIYSDACRLGFFKGVLLEDPRDLLVSPGENSQSSRYIPFTSVEQVEELEPVIRAYVAEAVKNEEEGVEVEFKAPGDITLPAELLERFEENPDLEAAFSALTPGRRRGWVLHFSGAKQSKTRTARIDRATPDILAGKGMHDD